MDADLERKTIKFEGMLAGWKDSNASGQMVTLWLNDDAVFQRFRTMTARKGGKAGQRFVCVLVELGDDEQPVDTSRPAPGPKGSPLARFAAELCRTDLFLDWLADTFPAVWAQADKRVAEIDPSAGPEDVAAEAIRIECEVSSRAEFDTDTAAAARFHERIRKPWQAHNSARPA